MRELPPEHRQQGKNPRRDRDLAWLERLDRGEWREEVEWWGRGQAPPLLLRGLAEFNAGEHFQAHDTWEYLWGQERYPYRLFYQGLVKVAAALVHLGRGNPTGAVRLAHSGWQILEPFGSECLGVDVAALRGDVERLVETLVGKEGTPDAPLTEKLPRIRYRESWGKRY